MRYQLTAQRAFSPVSSTCLQEAGISNNDTGDFRKVRHLEIGRSPSPNPASIKRERRCASVTAAAGGIVGRCRRRRYASGTMELSMYACRPIRRCFRWSANVKQLPSMQLGAALRLSKAIRMQAVEAAPQSTGEPLSRDFQTTLCRDASNIQLWFIYARASILTAKESPRARDILGCWRDDE